MNRVVKHSDKHPVVNADLFIETSLEENRLVCLSDRDVFIIRSYLWPFVEWSTRLARPIYGDYWQLSSESELLLFKEACQALDNKIGVKNVDCINQGLSDIASALRYMADKQSSSGGGCCECGSGSGGTGTSQPPFSEVETPTPGEGDPPDGFEDWEQFFANKCAVATDIVNTLIGDVNRMGTLNLVGLTLAGLVGGMIPILLTPIPYDDIVVIAGVLLVVLGFGATLLDKVGSVLSDHTSDFICALYNASSASEAQGAFLAKFDELWADDGYDPLIGFSAHSMMSSMVGSGVTNRLFTLDTTRVLPEGDCSECEEDECNCDNAQQVGLLETGTDQILPGNFSTNTLYEGVSPPIYGIYLDFHQLSCFYITELVGWTRATGEYAHFADYSTLEDGTPNGFIGDPQPVDQIIGAIRWLYIYSATPFSVEISCEPGEV